MTDRRPRARGFRRVERWIVGVGFAMIAFVLERVVMHAVRRKGEAPRAAPSEGGTITSHGGDVDVG